MNRIKYLDHVDITILSELAAKPLHFNELARRLRSLCSRRTLQRRLRALVDAGLLYVKVDGQYKFYCIRDDVLRAGIRLLETLSRVAKVTATEPLTLDEMGIVFTLADMTWYYVWFIYMTRKEVGRILLTMLMERYWPALFSLLTKYIENKGVKLEKSLEAYISKLTNALEGLRIEVVNQVDVKHRELFHELINAVIDAYHTLANTMTP